MDEKKLTALVSKARGGDQGAFEKLYAEHARSILFHVRSLIVDKESYTDVAQDVALEMYKHLGQLRQPAAFRSWMHRIVRTTCADHNRSLMSHEKNLATGDNEELLESIEDTDSSSDPEALVLASLEGNQLFALVNELSVNYREIIVQRYYDDLSYKEIADSLGISVSNVSTRLQRAMEALRKKIGEPDERAAGLTGAHPVRGVGSLDRGKEMNDKKEQMQEAGDTFFTHKENQSAEEYEEDMLAAELTKEQEKELGLNDDIGLSPSLYSGVAVLISDETVNAVVSSVSTKLTGISVAATITGTTVATVGVIKHGATIFAGIMSVAVTLFAVATCSMALQTQSGLPWANEQSMLVKSSETYDYGGSMHLVFSDANGGSSDTNVVAIALIEDEAAAVSISWELRSLGNENNSTEGAVSESTLVSGEGAEVDSAALASLAPGKYQVAFILIDSEGASAEITRSFTIQE